MGDIRWQQRLNSYQSALRQLANAVQLSRGRALSDLEKQGLIQAFEFTHELAWNLLKDYLSYQGNTSITGSRDAVREAYKVGLISHGDVWMEMIASRNHTSHAYNQTVADDIATKTVNAYYPLFEELKTKMEGLRSA